MRIVTLTAENVKRIKAVEITPDGNVVVIAGRNAQGKSSVLDAIWMALAGGAGAKETTRPIRDGEEKASVTLDLGDLKVTRRWTQAGTTLDVAAADGAKYPSPQTLLDGLIGRLSFDPLAFANQDPKGQLATLLSVVDLPFVPEEVDASRRGIFDERTEANRDVKRLEAQIAGVAVPPEGTPDAEVSAVSIAEELSVALEAETKRVSVTEQYQRAKAITEQRAADVKRIEQELADARDVLTAATESESALLAEGKQLPAKIDPEPIRARLAEVDQVNEHVRRKQERRRLTAQLNESRELTADLTTKLAEIDKAKADAIAAAEMPLDGLGFDEDGVLYQGVPFSQASAAERLRVGIAVAMALNPKIRVIRITDGSLLDSENLALIEQMAGEHDFQVWLERVDETGTVGITIEDGQVAGITESVAA